MQRRRASSPFVTSSLVRASRSPFLRARAATAPLVADSRRARARREATRAMSAPCPARALSRPRARANAVATEASASSTGRIRSRRVARSRARSRALAGESAGESGDVRSRARAAVERANRALEAEEAQEREEETSGSVARGSDASAVGRDGTQEVRLIVTDVDGTLLNSRQELSERTAAALKEAAALGVPTVVATGKTRGPWARSLYEKLGEENRKMPGLFIQGLVTCDGRGTVLKSRTLGKADVKKILRFAKTRNSVVVAFCGENIVCSTRNEYTDKVLDYGEPEPVECGDLLARSDEYDVNKVLLFGDDESVKQYRVEAETILADACDITVAVPGMLEFLPKGASKGSAVRELCEAMDIDPANVMALGDGENDKEMLAYVGLGVAVGNASAATKSVADVVMMETNDDDAVAKAVEKYVIEPRKPQEEGEATSRESIVVDAIRSGEWLTSRAEALDEARIRAEREARARAREKVQEAKSKAAYQKLLKKQSTPEERKAAEAELEDELMSKIVAEEKFVGFVRAFARGAQRIGEVVVQELDDASTDEDESSDEDDDLARIRRQRERLEKLKMEFEATKAALSAAAEKESGKLRVKLPPKKIPTQEEQDEDAREFIRSETNKIMARTSLQNAADKAQRDAKKSDSDFLGMFTSALKLGGLGKRGSAEVDAAKARLLAMLLNVDGGRDCSSDVLSRIMNQVEVLEGLNPTKKCAKSPLMLGLWSCAFTNCPQILGTQGGLNMTALRQKNAVTFFCYDTDAGLCEIDRGWPLRRLRATVSYSSDESSLELDIPRDIGVLGALGWSPPSENRNYSSLQVTFLDGDLKICRGRNDMVYVFVQNDSTFRLERADQLSSKK